MDSYYRDEFRRTWEKDYRKGYENGWYDAEQRKRGLRRSRNSILLGVCQGFADWLEIPAWPLRLGVVIAFIASGFWPVGALYLVAAIAMKPESR